MLDFHFWCSQNTPKNASTNSAPNAPPSVEGYAFYEFYEPANKLGGDYFDYIILPDGRVAVIVADVIVVLGADFKPTS